MAGLGKSVMNKIIHNSFLYEFLNFDHLALVAKLASDAKAISPTWPESVILTRYCISKELIHEQ
jgi:hypothetical protein